MFKLTKEHEGKEMWCIPTGNNVPRGQRNSKDLTPILISFTEIKRKRVKIGYSIYSLKDYGNTKYKAVYENNNNYGYIVFDSIEGLISYEQRLRNDEIIKNSLSSYTINSRFTDDQIKRIAEILREGE